MNEKLRAVCISSVVASFFSTIACCGYIYWEHHHGNQGPDMMRGLDYPAIIALAIAYSVILFIPSILIIRKCTTKPLLVLTASVNYFGVFMTLVGFASLLF